MAFIYQAGTTQYTTQMFQSMVNEIANVVSATDCYGGNINTSLIPATLEPTQTDPDMNQMIKQICNRTNQINTSLTAGATFESGAIVVQNYCKWVNVATAQITYQPTTVTDPLGETSGNNWKLLLEDPVGSVKILSTAIASRVSNGFVANGATIQNATNPELVYALTGSLTATNATLPNIATVSGITYIVVDAQNRRD